MHRVRNSAYRPTATPPSLVQGSRSAPEPPRTLGTRLARLPRPHLFHLRVLRTTHIELPFLDKPINILSITAKNPSIRKGCTPP